MLWHLCYTFCNLTVAVINRYGYKQQYNSGFLSYSYYHPGKNYPGIVFLDFYEHFLEWGETKLGSFVDTSLNLSCDKLIRLRILPVLTFVIFTYIMLNPRNLFLPFSKLNVILSSVLVRINMVEHRIHRYWKPF